MTVNKADYEKIMRSVKSWAGWKRELCNDMLLISKHSPKV